MNIPAVKNKNYCAVVVAMDRFVDLPNCDNVKAAIVFGNSVIVGKDSQAGDVCLYFPVETALSSEFLSNNNLYRKAEYGNVDTTSKGGFFEQHGRVKAVKFRGHKSEGFVVPVGFLGYLGIDYASIPLGTEIDEIDGRPICKKYVAKRNIASARKGESKKSSVQDKIVDGQFRFHEDTENLRRNIHKVNPGDFISLTVKKHGTSVVIGNLLVNRDLKWYEKLAQWLGVEVNDKKYGIVWSSRRVIKGVDSEPKDYAVHYYGSDIWGEVAKEVGPMLPAGFTVYAEIVGYTSDGAMIQKGYHYGCRPGTHKTYVYRVTFTNVDGQVFELSWPNVKEFCDKYGLQFVPELMSRRARDWHEWEYMQDHDEWRTSFLSRLESSFVDIGMCPYNKNEVPYEGICLRIDHMQSAEVYKLKQYIFLEWESKQLDSGEPDIESEESVGEEEVTNEQ